jgi:hypothetical protein
MAVRELPERLRVQADEIDRAVSRDKDDRENAVFCEIELMREAANEIERLRKIVQAGRALGVIDQEITTAEFQELAARVKRLERIVNHLCPDKSDDI